MATAKVLIDINICLDAILSRKPFAADALELIERSQLGDFGGLIAAHSFDTMFYILNKRIGRTKTNKGLKEIRRAFDVASVTQSIIDEALKFKWDDFEDAIHYYAAKEAGCEAIITRNSSDFKQGELSVLSPIQFLKRLDQ